MRRDELVEHVRDAGLISGLAAAANAVFILFARRTAGISIEFEPLLLGPVVISTILAGFGAYVSLELLKTYTGRPYEYFAYLSGLVLILSFMPIGHTATSMEGAGMAEINVLGTTHVIAATVIIIGMTRKELMKR